MFQELAAHVLNQHPHVVAARLVGQPVGGVQRALARQVAVIAGDRREQDPAAARPAHGELQEHAPGSPAPR